MSGEGQQQQAATFDSSAFYASLEGDDKAFVERKGLNKPGADGKLPSPVELARGWANAEKLIGQNRLPEPNLADDKARSEWQGWDALGAPKDAKDYKFERPQMPKGLDGQPIAYDETAETAFRDQAAKLRMPQFMFEAIMKEQIGSRLAQAAGNVAEMANQKTAIETTLRKDFGAGYESALKQASSALSFLAKEAKLDEGRLADLASAEFGSEETARLFITLGKMLGEGQLNGGQDKGFTPGVTEAKAEIERLKLDSTFQTAYQNKDNTGHKAAVERMTRLMQTAHG